MRAPSENLTRREASRMVRRVAEQAGSVPRDAFTCLIDRRGRVEAAFVLEL